MGCGKSKHDVVTGNTTKVRKPSEPDQSVKGKESESFKRQESCRCGEKKEISAVFPGDQTETTTENDTKKLEEKEDGGGEKIAVEMASDEIKPEEKETINPLPPVEAIVPENIVTEETVNDIKENVSPVDEQKEEINMETLVEEEKSLENKNEDDLDSKIPSPEVDEDPKRDEQTPATDSEVQEIENKDIAKENDETTVLVNEEITKANDEIETAEKEIEKENDEITNDIDEIAVTENEEITKENEETPVLDDNVAVDTVEESPVDITKEVESA